MSFEILRGDCVAMMQCFVPSGSVKTCVTSPPYFGLRDYGHSGQIGLEKTPDEFVAKLVDVFREVRRVLRDDGTLWVNMGDSYAGSGRGGNSDAITGRGRDASIVSSSQRDNAISRRGSQLDAGLHESQRQGGAIGRAWVPPPPGFKNKQLLGVPWRLAFALQDDGWFLRQDIIWSKPNPMPESVGDRCTKAHEYIFLFSKSPRYYFDADAIKEPAVGAASGASETRNKRSVWTVATRGYKGAHFATYPPALIEPCILAGSKPGDTVLDPFGGSGTTAQVAMQHGRSAVVCELNPEYVGLIEQRLAPIQDMEIA